jgi:hypothetical protein
MIRTIAILAATATAAHAQDRAAVHHDPGAGDAWFARVTVQNLRGVYNRTETHDTAHGPVALSYTTTLPSQVNDPASADSACIVDMPEGVAAYPVCIEIMELETGEIFLFQYLGG